MIEPTPDLWHYTCLHSARLLEGDPVLLPASELSLRATGWQARLVWLTDRPSPLPADALGLDPAKQVLTSCDRTAYRFHVIDPARAIWWPTWRRANRPPPGLELAEGARPAHWWVSSEPVPVEPAFLS